MDQGNRKKRTRDELGVSSSDSPEVKLARVDSEANSPLDLEPDRDELVEVREDLLSIFDDSDEPVVQGLESVIKSFEEEIHVGVPVLDMSSDSGGSQTDLGYLLEASDDELGLPPTFAVGEEKDAAAVAVLPAEEGPGTVGFVEMLGFEDEIASYDSFELGLVGNTEGNHNYCDNNGDFVALGGLFDFSDENSVPADISGLLWQPELSAL
ncbi:PREDICTED: uncharacterized protein LOC105108082 [Populus euphratica]|uniref:Uncharacterized protein LOC105108082 n=1 Tax=Populus euphratica TaxID=75702 RepID=A0AAJ6SWV6_POPEU|nr:PREDICTED: uncharacterized protein LOC105108082 [Populus euphratica]